MGPRAPRALPFRTTRAHVTAASTLPLESAPPGPPGAGPGAGRPPPPRIRERSPPPPGGRRRALRRRRPPPRGPEGAPGRERGRRGAGRRRVAASGRPAGMWPPGPARGPVLPAAARPGRVSALFFRRKAAPPAPVWRRSARGREAGGGLNRRPWPSAAHIQILTRHGSREPCAALGAPQSQGSRRDRRPSGPAAALPRICAPGGAMDADRD